MLLIDMASNDANRSRTKNISLSNRMHVRSTTASIQQPDVARVASSANVATARPSAAAPGRGEIKREL